MQYDPRATGTPPSPIHPTGFFAGVQIRPVIVGVIVDYIATYAGMYAYFFVYLASKFSEQGELSQEALADYMMSREGLMIGFAIGALGTALGGFIAARKAGKFQIKHGAFVGLGSLTVSFIEEMLRGESMPMPEWFRALSILSIIPAGALGGYVAEIFGGALGTGGGSSGSWPPNRS
ncbi:MAG: YrzE family protein [Deltaproteobacteria bacterium]